MEVIRVYAESTGFNELYEGYLNSQLEKLIDKDFEENKDVMKGEVDE